MNFFKFTKPLHQISFQNFYFMRQQCSNMILLAISTDYDFEVNFSQQYEVGHFGIKLTTLIKAEF